MRQAIVFYIYISSVRIEERYRNSRLILKNYLKTESSHKMLLLR